MMKYALIVAGGKGVRMGSETPKQFLLLHHEPMLMRTIRAFNEFSKDIMILLVLHPSLREEWQGLCGKYHFNIDHSVVEGGQERFHSVRNGLQQVDDRSLVAIHDGVRPLVSRRLIEESYRLAGQYGSAVPVMAIHETIRLVKEGHSQPVDRSNLFSVQTPQTFQSDKIKEAYKQEFREDFTDDAAVLEASGEKIHFFPGDLENIKITRPQDLALAEKIMGR